MEVVAQLESRLKKLKNRYRSTCVLPELTIGTRTARIPIIQGGMGVGISLSNLASAVAEEGGIGVIAANAIGMIEDDYYENHLEANIRALRNEIRKARQKTSGLIGVNIMVAVDCFHQLLETAVKEKIDFLFLGAGLPIHGIPVQRIREAGSLIVPIVSSARATRLIFKSWEKRYNDIPDAVVVEGPKAGGHLGFKFEQIEDPVFTLEKIVPEVVEILREFEIKWQRKIPVIAAGGVFIGEDIYRFLKLGAKGVQLGTRFVATHECDADIRFKQAYIDCRKQDIAIIESPVGLPGRAIRNSFLDEVAAGVKKFFRCPSRCLESCAALEARYCISVALDNARKGQLDEGFAFCGSNAFRIEAIVSVRELMISLGWSYAVAAVTNDMKNTCDRISEKIKALKEEYAAIFANVMATVKMDIESVENLLLRPERPGDVPHMPESLLRIRREYNEALRKLARIQKAMADLLEQKLDLQAY